MRRALSSALAAAALRQQSLCCALDRPLQALAGAAGSSNGGGAAHWLGEWPAMCLHCMHAAACSWMKTSASARRELGVRYNVP